MEATINISFGLEVTLLLVFITGKEKLMKITDIVKPVCVWCEVALLRVCLVATSTQLEVGSSWK